ncbi:MAG: DUF86 domain-containing protein [Clostridia bacterium]|nr:DUF86 domain-containing protein [Clostridia bacterium]
MTLRELRKTKGITQKQAADYVEMPLRTYSNYGMRNKIVHEYSDVEFDVVYDTITQDIPKLRKKLKAIV